MTDHLHYSYTFGLHMEKLTCSCKQYFAELKVVKYLRLMAIIARRMVIANGTCVSFCNQPKAHFGLPWVRPGTIAVNVT